MLCFDGFLCLAADSTAALSHHIITIITDLLVRGLGEGNPEFDAAAAPCVELGSAVLAEHDEKLANLNPEALPLEEEQEARQTAKEKAKRKNC